MGEGRWVKGGGGRQVVPSLPIIGPCFTSFGPRFNSNQRCSSFSSLVCKADSVSTVSGCPQK